MESQVQNISGASQQDRVAAFGSSSKLHGDNLCCFAAALFQCEAPEMMPGFGFFGELFL